MFEYLRKILSNENSSLSSNNENKIDSQSHEKQLHIATAAIFIEMAKADGQFSAKEREQVITILQQQFNLEKDYIDKLIKLSTTELNDSVSLHEFSSVLNENFTGEDKFELLKNLWRLIYTDKKLDKYEDHLIKIIGGMLRMEHKQIINAKMLVREEFNLK